VTACGGSHHAAATPAAATTARAPARQTTLYVYSGLPLYGPQRSDSLQIEQGIRFGIRVTRKWAIAHHQPLAGYKVVYKALPDSARQPHRHHSGKGNASTPNPGPNQFATVQAAETAAANPDTVAYIGDLNSSATELSLPILNQAGIVQLTPGSGYPGLTEKVANITSDVPPPEPGRYYPHGRGSLLRLIPNDLVQAAAAIGWLKHDVHSCTTLATTQFGNDPEAVAMTRAIEYTAALPTYKLGFFKMDQPSNDTNSYEPDASVLAAHGVNCFVLAGAPTSAAVKFTTELHDKLPVGSVIVGTSSLCNSGWTRAVPAGVDPSLYCTTPVQRIASYPGGKHFSSIFWKADHRAPTAYTFWGYLAGTLVMDAINGIDVPDKRAAVMANLVNNVTNPDDAYTFDTPDGDLSPGGAGSTYGLDKVVHGVPTPDHVLTGSPVLPAS